MNNEPVAYVSTTGLNDIEWTDASHSLNYGDALYTHPAKCRCCNGYGLVGNIEDTVDCPVCHGEGFENHPTDLTDEEIIAVGNAVVNHIDSNEGWIEFARAILRKAQEK